jgi:hypothetical protein
MGKSRNDQFLLVKIVFTRNDQKNGQIKRTLQSYP